MVRPVPGLRVWWAISRIFTFMRLPSVRIGTWGLCTRPRFRGFPLLLVMSELMIFHRCGLTHTSYESDSEKMVRSVLASVDWWAIFHACLCSCVLSVQLSRGFYRDLRTSPRYCGFPTYWGVRAEDLFYFCHTDRFCLTSD